jgi:hypothetical protein
LLLCGAAYGQGKEEIVTSKVISPGEKVAIEPGQLNKPAVFKIIVGEVTLTIRVSPDGYVQIVDPGVRAVVIVKNNLDNRASLDMKTNETVSMWPIAKMVIQGGSGEFALQVDAAGWAFVIRADRVRPGGIKVLCDNMTCTLLTGERLDTDRVGDDVTFRRIGQAWPGRLVRDIKRTTKPVTVAELPPSSRADDSRPTMPGVLSGRSSEFPWQTVPLPTISWEVFRPADVSP